MAGSAEVVKFFSEVSTAVSKNPGFVADVGAILEFKVRGLPAPWFIDLKHGAGRVFQGTDGAAAHKADCTVEYASIADFNSINSGKLNLKVAIMTVRAHDPCVAS